MASARPETPAPIVAAAVHASRGPAVRWRSSRHQRLDDGFIQGEAMALDHAPGELHGESPARSCQRRGDVLVGVTATHKEAPTGDGDGAVFCDEAYPCDAAPGERQSQLSLVVPVGVEREPGRKPAQVAVHLSLI